MKDIVISEKKIKREVFYLAGSFIFSFLLNVFAVIFYKTAWFEVFSQIGYVVIITLVLYLIITFVRVMWWLVKKLFKR
jgi:hypothetical protein